MQLFSVFLSLCLHWLIKRYRSYNGLKAPSPVLKRYLQPIVNVVGLVSTMTFLSSGIHDRDSSPQPPAESTDDGYDQCLDLCSNFQLTPLIQPLQLLWSNRQHWFRRELITTALFRLQHRSPCSQKVFVINLPSAPGPLSYAPSPNFR